MYLPQITDRNDQPLFVQEIGTRVRDGLPQWNDLDLERIIGRNGVSRDDPCRLRLPKHVDELRAVPELLPPLPGEIGLQRFARAGYKSNLVFQKANTG